MELEQRRLVLEMVVVGFLLGDGIKLVDLGIWG